MTYTAKNVYELNFVSRWLKFCMMAFSPKPILEYAVGLLFSQPYIYIDGWLYAMSMTSVVCNVPVLSQNDFTYHHSVFTT